MKKFRILFFVVLIPFVWGFSQQTDKVEILPPPAPISEAEEEYSDEVYDETYDETYEEIVTPTREERGPIYYEQRNLEPKFKDKYKGEKYNYDKVEKERKEIRPPSFNFPAGLFEFLMYGILAVIILLIIFYIVKNAGGFHFGNEKRQIKVQTSEELDEEDIEHIANNNFEHLIQKAKAEKDFRKAVRYYYLWVLQKLTDRKLIQFNKDKTDYEYWVELGQNPIKEDFSQNTYIYDYIWYGKFNLNESEFAIAESIFQRTLNKIR